MTKRQDDPPARPKRSRLKHGSLWLAMILIVLALLTGLVALGLTGRVIAAPAWVVQKIEDRANTAFAGEFSARIGGLELLVERNFVPRVRLTDVWLFSRQGRQIATMPDLRATLYGEPLLRGRIQPRNLRMAGARFALRRLADGTLDVAPEGTAALADEGGFTGTAVSLVEMLAAIDRVFELPVLRDIEQVRVEGLDIELEDQRSDMIWSVTNSRLTLDQDARQVAISVDMDMGLQGGASGQVHLDFLSQKNSPEARLDTSVRDISARELAAQSPALAFLAALDAPISGALSSSVDKRGTLSTLRAELSIGKGALQPTETTRPIGFDAAHVVLGYDPARQRITFDKIEVDGPSLRARATGGAILSEFADGLPQSIVAQIALDDLRVDPEGVFADPVSFDRGALDFRLRPAPFRIEVGQLSLTGAGSTISASGRAEALPGGWALAADAVIDRISSERLLALWPPAAVAKTRLWFSQNVATSELFDAHAALRLSPGEEPRLTLGYEFRDAEVRAMRTMPVVRDGAGYSAINDFAYTLVLDKGHIIAPEGGQVTMDGTVMEVPDIRVKPAPARFRLRTESSIEAALSILDQPPFKFMTKAGMPVNLAEGRAEVAIDFDTILKKGVKPQEVGFGGTARLTGLSSDRIVPGRRLTADALDLEVDRAALSISGPLEIDGFPMTARWTQKFGPEHKGKSRVEGRLSLSQKFLDTFGIGLPRGMVAGAAAGDIVLDLVKGAPTRYRLSSGLSGARLSIPALAYTKAAGTAGKLVVAGALGRPATVEWLDLSAPGLSAKGSVRLAPSGGLERARFTEVAVGDWFSGAVDLIGRGKGRPAGVEIRSGTADIGKARFGPPDPGAAPVPLSVTLQRLKVTPSIALDSFTGTFVAQNGLKGAFTAAVNKTAGVTGKTTPQNGGTRVTLSSDNAGAVLLASRIFPNMRNGALDMTLNPRRGGGYDGQVRIRNVRVVHVPALADLLNAISVVGLLDQLNGPGLTFTEIIGKFVVTRDAVEISEGSAIGPSMGISTEGLVYPRQGRIDLQGVISPIYIINGIGQIFSRSREGLFGFNYRMRGAANDPEVSVNPLSILTPGMFRDLFRSAPPQLEAPAAAR